MKTEREKPDTIIPNKSVKTKFAYMTSEEIELLLAMGNIQINVYSDAYQEMRGNVNQLTSLDFRGLPGTIYLGITVPHDGKYPRAVHIRQSIKTWRKGVCPLYYYRSYTVLQHPIEIYLIKYYHGYISKWNPSDKVLNFLPWRNFYKNVICEEVDPYNPDKSANAKFGDNDITAHDNAIIKAYMAKREVAKPQMAKPQLANNDSEDSDDSDSDDNNDQEYLERSDDDSQE